MPCVLVGALALCASALAAGGEGCPNESLRYGYGAHLPDCRAYEQATPIDKDGTNPQLTWNGIQAAEGGGGITFFTRAGVPGATGAAQLTSFFSMRSADGWITQGLLPPGAAGQESYMMGWTPSVNYSVATAILAGSGTTLLARNDGDGSVKTIVPYIAGSTKFSFDGASADGSTLFFEEAKGAQLAPEAVAGKDNVYVWNQETGTISLVGVLPESACGLPPCTPAGGSFVGAYNWWDGTVSSGGGSEMFFIQAQHAISTSGDRVYFTAGGTGQLYLRENPASPTATTMQVTASQKTNGTGPDGTDANGPRPAVFMMATPDGSQAFFTSPEELTNDANTGTADQGSDLYRYEAGSGGLTDLTPDASDSNGAEVKGVLGVSEDGSDVYFAANGDLDGSGPATPGDCSNSLSDSWSGECNLYVFHEGKTTFVARVNASGTTNFATSGSASDATNWIPKGKVKSGGALSLNTARVSANGQVLIFRSQSKLTAYESEGIPEYYRYDVTTGELGCVSCNPSGVAPSSAPALTTQTTFAGIEINGIQTRNMSATGNQFFFETAEALLPQDINGVSDVYEWEADGAGSCSSAFDDGGCLYLLSTGDSPDASNFADASASGEDAFIFTYQPLVGQDEDQLVDAYDVRVDGGLASQRSEPATLCSGEDCKRPATTSLLDVLPGSTTFTGAGNVALQKHCASQATRYSHLSRRVKAVRHHVRRLDRRIHRLRGEQLRSKATHLRRKARGLHTQETRGRRRLRRVEREAKLAAAARKKCQADNSGSGE
ncbi:MAG: hypothetical protein ACRDK7_04630 [Solirubrobacteraceae bacterium]